MSTTLDTWWGFADFVGFTLTTGHDSYQVRWSCKLCHSRGVTDPIVSEQLARVDAATVEARHGFARCVPG